MRGATPCCQGLQHDLQISIHAPLAGRDCGPGWCRRDCGNFNPRAPCGARQTDIFGETYTTIFQSTRPLRGATGAVLEALQKIRFQSTRPLRGATSQQKLSGTCSRHFNPRAPCGARPGIDNRESNIAKFQSTRPLRGATTCAVAEAWQTNISIHAPLAGRDRTHPSALRTRWYFNPRAPCGARRVAEIVGEVVGISIHAPLAGRDGYCSKRG